MDDLPAVPVPQDLLEWHGHCLILHGEHIPASRPLDEYWEFHQLDHQDPGPGHIPHRHSEAPPVAVTEHGFW